MWLKIWLVRQCRTEYEWECKRADMIHRHMATNVYRTEGGTIRLGKSTPGMLEAEIDGYPFRLLRPPLQGALLKDLTHAL